MNIDSSLSAKYSGIAKGLLMSLFQFPDMADAIYEHDKIG